jgi:hypothetical protein
VLERPLEKRYSGAAGGKVECRWDNGGRVGGDVVCNGVLWCAMLCCGVLCYAMLCCAVLSCFVPWFVFVLCILISAPISCRTCWF